MSRSLLAGLILSAIFSSSLAAYPFSFGINSIGNAAIAFDPTDLGAPAGNIGTFSFTNDTVTGYDFKISSMTGGWPFGQTSPGADNDLLELKGKITGTYGIQSPITTVLPGPPQTIESASVVNVGAGPHRMEIYNSSDVLAVTADISWVDIQVTTAGGGGSGAINVTNGFNLSNFTCLVCTPGTNLYFLGNTLGDGKVKLTFQDTANEFSLSSLTTGTTTTTFTAYSGTATVPEPGFYGLLVLGMSGLGWFALRRRQSEVA